MFSIIKYTNMETLNIEDVLVEKNLRFRLRDGGSYVRSKESKNFLPFVGFYLYR